MSGIPGRELTKAEIEKITKVCQTLGCTQEETVRYAVAAKIGTGSKAGDGAIDITLRCVLSDKKSAYQWGEPVMNAGYQLGL